MFVQRMDLEFGEPIWTGGNCHIYDNRTEQVRTRFSRIPNARPSPTLRLERAESIDSYDVDNIDASQGYKHRPTIKAPAAV